VVTDFVVSDLVNTLSRNKGIVCSRVLMKRIRANLKKQKTSYWKKRIKKMGVIALR